MTDTCEGRCEPAYSLVARLGGASAVALGIRRYTIENGGDQRARSTHTSTVCRWTMPKETSGGTGGLIPVRYWPAIIKTGRAQGITVTISDLSPPIAKALGMEDV